MSLRKHIRQILKESVSMLFSIEDVFDLIEYHDSFKDLYPGYNPDSENEYQEDYYYPSKEKAYEEVGHVIHFFEQLPNPIPVYRAIQVKSLDDVRHDYLGDSWTYERQSALDFAENHNGGNVLISAKVTKDNVDWKETLRNNFLFSEGMDNFDENEIKVNDTDLLIDVKVEWIKNIVKENSSSGDFKLNRYVYHASNVSNRDRIEKYGIVPYRGVQWLGDTPIQGKAVFATNSEDKSEWFDSTWDDDIWRIDTSKIKDVQWFMDPNMDNGVWIYTKSVIPRNAIEMIKVGTGKDLLENDASYSLDDVQKMQSMHQPSSDIIFGANSGDKFKDIKIDLNDIKAPKNLNLDFYKKKNLDEDVYIVEKLMKLINSGVEINPIVVDEHNKIMDGLHRYVAHKEMYQYYNGPSQIRVYKKGITESESAIADDLEFEERNGFLYFKDSLGGSGFLNIEKGHPHIVDWRSLPIEKNYSSDADSYKRRGFAKKVIKAIKDMGYNDFYISMPSHDAIAALNSMSAKGTITPVPGSERGPSIAEYFTHYLIN